MFSASKTAVPSGYNIANSLRFRSSASAYLNRTPSVSGNRTTWTWSAWVKRGSLGTQQTIFGAGDGTGNNYAQIAFSASTNTIDFINVISLADSGRVITTQVFRDPSSWYHIVAVWDSSQATSSNRMKLYVNGQQVTAFGTANYPTQNTNSSINNTVQHTLSSLNWSSRINYFDGYLTEVNFIDGQALTPSSFGEIDSTTGVWKARRYTGTYGTNGFRLNFSNGTSTTTLGYDSSGNGNNWTTNNISLTAGSTYDWMIDSPTPYQGSSYGVGNYCVLNSVYAGSGAYISNGNLTLTSNDATYRAAYSTIGMTSGSWYAEFYVGLRNADMGISVANLNNGIGYYYLYTGAKWDTSTSSAAYGASYTTGDTIGVAFDSTNLTLTFYKNGVSQGVAFTGMTSGTYQFVVYSQGAGANLSFNAGQRPFAYTPPSGYKSLCTQNLPGVTIQNGAQYMAASLFTGTSSSAQSVSNTINNVGFQPDFVWIKSRSNTQSNYLVDSVRGGSSLLRSDTTGAESTGSVWIQSFDAYGFTATNNILSNGYTYVGWQWKAGGTAVTNTAGSITSSVSANTTAGFSVVTYTGTGANATVGHGLGVAPSMVIVKNRATAATSWIVYHASLSNTQALYLNTTDAVQTSNLFWNNTSPTSSVFSVAAYNPTNQASTNIVAYCFAAIPGYSAFGSYTGNGSADGPFVYCGFRPRFVMIKRTDSTGHDWPMRDAARSPYNEVKNTLLANSSNAEATNNLQTDFLSNGFKLRDTGGNGNASGGTYIYAAFAENPFQNALAR